MYKKQVKNKVNNFTESEGRLVIESDQDISEELKQLHEVKILYNKL